MERIKNRTGVVVNVTRGSGANRRVLDLLLISFVALLALLAPGFASRGASVIDDGESGLELHPIQRIEDPAAYAGQGMTWLDAGVQLRNLPGYMLEHVWASAFALPFQVAGLHDGSLAVGDKERRRILRVAETGVSTLLTEVNANWMATLPDGRLAYYSRSGTLMGLDVATGKRSVVFRLPGIDEYRSPIAVDTLGRIYGIEPTIRSLIRVTPGGGLEALSGPLPYAQSWYITDLEVAADGTVYIGGYSLVVAVAPDRQISTIADGLNFEPVFLDIGDDGTVYINELAKGFQAYSPTDGSLRSLQIRHGFGDFVAFDAHDFAFYDPVGAFYHHDPGTGDLSPVARADTLNTDAFAAAADGSLYASTAAIAPWGSHIVQLSSSGLFKELSDEVYCYIASMDVDTTGRLCYIADDALRRVERNGSISSWDLQLPGGGDLHAASLACAPDGTWVVLARSDEEVRVYRVTEGGQGRELTGLRFTRTSFSGSAETMDDARIDVGPDGRITMIVTARVSLHQGPYIQRVVQARADGSERTEIANLDCQRIAGMVDVAVDASGVVYALGVTGNTGDPDCIYRIVPGEQPEQIIVVAAGRDPRSIDVGPDGTIWFGTTLGVFRAYPTDED